MTKQVEHFLPIIVEVCHDACLENLIVEGKMRKDFGPWKSGELKTLSFDFEKGTCEEHDDDGNLIASVKIDLVVIS